MHLHRHRPAPAARRSFGPPRAAFAWLALAACAACGGGGSSAALQSEYESLRAAGAVQVTAAASPAQASADDTVDLSVTVTTTRATVVDVTVGVERPDGSSAYALKLPSQVLTPSAPFHLADGLTVESTDPAGDYVVSVTVVHSGTGKTLRDQPAAARFTVGGGATSSDCPGTDRFCDDYTSSALASAYATDGGTWTRASGSYAVRGGAAWDRAYAFLADDLSDFDVTVRGQSSGDAGFGLTYAASSGGDGFAVIVHPAQFQGVYLKRLVPGGQDVNLKSFALPSQAPGTSMTLRVRRAGTAVTVWLDGKQILTGDDGGTGRHGKLGLVLSETDKLTGSGAKFTLLKVASATAVGGGDTDPGDGNGDGSGDGNGDGNGQTCQGTWLSGSSGEETANGAFGAWKGTPDTIAGTWSDTASSLGDEFADWTENIDLGVWGIWKQSNGESWAAAASGAYDARWKATLQAVAAWLSSRPDKTVFIRFAYEFNGDFMKEYNVYPSELASYKAAFARFHGLKQQIAPRAKLVWPVNDGTSTGLDMSQAYPGSDVVDVIGVDSYNQYPWVNDEASFDEKINATRGGNPLGIEAWRQFAEARGKPLAIPEWGSSNDPSGDSGGGDAPNYIELFHDWVAAHAGNGPGQVWYDVYFDVAGFGDGKFELYPDAHGAPQAAAKYRSLTWGSAGTCP